MTRLILLAPLLAACAAEPPPRAATAINGGPAPHMLIQVTGPAANEGKSQRCTDEINLSGYVQDYAAPVRAVLILQNGSNRLQIISRVRGIVRNEDLPGWDMGRLCRTAIDGILPVLAQEPPPGYAMAPPPASAAPSVQLAPAPTPYVYTPPPARRPPPVAAPPPAPAAPLTPMSPPADAPRAIADLARRGEQSFARGDYGNALVAYAEANRIASSPPLLFDTALCYRALNRPQEALQYIQLYLDRAPQGPNRPAAERFAYEIRRQLGDEE